VDGSSVRAIRGARVGPTARPLGKEVTDMNKTEKEAAVSALHEKMAKATFVAAVAFNKLDAQTAIDLRKAMRKAKIDYKVVKNTLAKKAAQGTDVARLEAHFVGPVAVAIGYDEMVASAKALAEFVKKAPEGALTVKGAVAGGETFDAKGVEALSKLPSLPETRAMLLALINTPAQQIARAIQAYVEESEKKAA
jgi:large subunit ribosomal protein L10